MPFKSFKQQKYLFAKEPALAKKWANKYGVLKKDKEGRKSAAKRLLKKLKRSE